MLGFLLRYINNNNFLYLGLLFVFGIIFGLNGIKVLMYFTAPCILTFTIVFIYKLIYKNKNISFIKPLMIGTIASSISTFIGVVIYIFVITKIYSCSSFYAVWDGFCINNFAHAIITYLQSLGHITNDFFVTDVSISGIERVIGIFGILNAIVFIISLISLLSKKFEICKDKLLFIFIVCAYAIDAIVFTLTRKTSNGSYWLPLVPFRMIVVEMFLETIK